MKLADRIKNGELHRSSPGLIPIAELITALFELSLTHHKALEQRCLLMTVLTTLLLKENSKVSVFDLFVRDVPKVYTSSKFNYMPLVTSISNKNYTTLPDCLNFSSTDYTLDTEFGRITPEQFTERFPIGMLTGAMMQAGQLAVDSMIFDCRNPEETYAIFFKSKYSRASTADASVSPLDLLDEYRLFQENIVPKLIGMLFVFTCRQPTYLISFRSHGR